MLKFLYKTFLVSVLSGSLATMNMVAFADDNQTKATTTSSLSTAGMSQPGEINREADGTLVKKDSVKLDGNKNNDGPIQIITMLAVGVIGTKLLMYKKWTTDMTVVAVASAAYIAAEIMNILNLKNQITEMNVDIERRSDGKNDQAQIEMLAKLKESYEKAKSTAKTKKMLQMGAAAAFLVATGIAAWQRMTEEGMYASCEAAIAQAQAGLSTCSAAVYTTAECTTCMGIVTATAAALKAVKVSREPPAPSAAKAVQQNTATVAAHEKPCPGPVAAANKALMTGACESYLTTKVLNEAYGTIPVTGYNSVIGKTIIVSTSKDVMTVDPTIQPKNLLRKMFDSLFPKAEAGMLSMLGLGAGAAAAYFTAQTSIGHTIDTYLFTPGGRMIAWGIMTAAAFMAAGATQKEIDKMQANIDKIDKILKDLGTLQKAVKLGGVKEKTLTPMAFKGPDVVPLTTSKTDKTECLAGSTSGTCNSVSDSLNSLPDFASLPSSFKTLATQSAKLGDGLSGAKSISGTTLNAANSLGGKAAAIGKLTNAVKAKLKDTLAKNGTKADFDKDEKALLGKINHDTAAAFGARGVSPSSFMSSVGLSPLGDAKAAMAPELNKKGEPSIAAPGIAPSKKGGNEFDLDFKEAEGELAGAAGAGAAGGEKFDIGNNDINANNGASIFEIISDRYIKSGYPKLLEEIPVKQ